MNGLVITTNTIFGEYKMNTISLGDICKSKYYLSLERRCSPSRFAVFTGKTYVGTTQGLVISLGRFVLLGHIREGAK